MTIPHARQTFFLIFLALAAAGCSGGTRPVANPFTFIVEPSIAPDPATLENEEKGQRPLAASQDENGVVSVFIANEVVLATENPKDVDDFLSAHAGELLETDEIPDPPAGLGGALDPDLKKPHEYVIRVDPSAFPLDDLPADAEEAGFGGARKLSSDLGARLYALVMKERARGRDAGLNFYFPPQANLLNRTEENPTGGGFSDAFNWEGLRFQSYGAKADVTRAWQFVQAHGIKRRINLAVIDGGFWLDGSGVPLGIANGGKSDFPIQLHQYDFNGDDYFAGGSNPSSCTGGTPCPWHGNDCASTALAIPNNQYGAAGTGGLVADPFLFKTDYTRSQVRRAVLTAEAWGADVVSMSFGGSCNLDCWSFMSSTFAVFQNAMKAGVVLVGAAGNDNLNVQDDPPFPCLVESFDDTPGVLCVGALADNDNKRISYSNYGGGVDIYAPTNVWAMPSSAGGGLTIAGGTSASTPFVAGIVALMKSINPDLTPSEVQKDLFDSAWTDSPDPKVTRYVNAFEAVKLVAGGKLPADSFEPNDSVAAAKHVDFGYYMDSFSLNTDFDYFSFSLGDYSSLDVTLDYMTFLGEPKLYWAGSAAGVQTETDTTDGKLIHNTLLPPGDYKFLLEGEPNHYHMKLVATPEMLVPDQFENNETPLGAKLPKAGSYLVNLHNDTDVDNYRFDLTGIGGINPFEFRVVQADRSVVLSLYKYVNSVWTLQWSWPASQTPSQLINEDGSYVVEIKRTAVPKPIRYTFHSGITIDKSIFQLAIPVDDIWIIDHTDPILQTLVGLNEGFAFQPDNFIFEFFTDIQLVGEGLKITLFDAAGKAVSKGVDFSTRIGVGQTLTYAGLPGRQTYLLAVERKDVSSVADTVFPMLQYVLSFR